MNPEFMLLHFVKNCWDSLGFRIKEHIGELSLEGCEFLTNLQIIQGVLIKS